MKIQNNQQGKTIVSQTAQNGNTFETAKRTFETAFTSGKDYGNELQTLGMAIARSIIRKVIDPQSKTATEKDTVSNSGINSSLVTLRREITTDTALLESTANNANKATALCYTADGDLQTTVIDKDAMTAVNTLIEKALGDGIDLVQEACVAILEQADRTTDHGEGWLDRPFTVLRLSKKVLIKTNDTATWKEVETTAMQEVYREVRRYIQNSRAMQTDPRNGYHYLEDMAVNPDDDTALETVYRRLKKWADMDDEQTVDEYYFAREQLGLTDRQETIIGYREQGFGYEAIAKVMGVSKGSITNATKAVAVKAEKVGFIPSKRLLEIIEKENITAEKMTQVSANMAKKDICDTVRDLLRKAQKEESIGDADKAEGLYEKAYELADIYELKTSDIYG